MWHPHLPSNVKWRSANQKIFRLCNAVEDWADFDLLRKAPTVVIALEVVKTVDKGCQTLTPGHKSTRSLFQGNDFVDHFCIPY